MEFVRVLFPTSRRVRIDGTSRGTTNATLPVEAGTHRFTLAGNTDYSPPFDDRTVIGTTADFPLVVQFMPLAAEAAERETATLDAIAPEPAPRRAAKRRPAAKKKPAKKKPAKKKPAKKKPVKKSAKKAGAKSKGAKRARR